MMALAMLAYLAKVAKNMKGDGEKKGEREKTFRHTYVKQQTIDFGNLKLADNETNQQFVNTMEAALTSNEHIARAFEKKS